MLNATILSAGKMCEVSFLAEQGLWEVLMLPRKRCEELLATLKQLGGKLRVLSMGSGVLPMTKKSRFIPTLTILTVGMREVSGLQLPSEQKFEREKYQRLSGAGSGKAATYCFYVVFMWHDFLSFFLSLFFFYYIFFFSLFFVSLFIFRSVTMNKYLTLSGL